jgi:plastocyanin
METKAGMNRMNRRRFVALSSAGLASAVLVACGNESPSAEELNPTQIPDVAGAPPTLAPMASPPSTSNTGAATGGQQPATGGEQAAGGGTTANVSAIDLGFEPKDFSVAPGGKIVLKNDGALQHDMAVDEWGGVIIDLLNGGETGEFTVPDDAKVGNSFTFYCSVPGHREAGMEGTITIAEAGADGGGEEATAEEATAEEGGAPVGGAAAEVDVTASEMMFDPAEIDVSPGTKIKLTNGGMLEHDMAVDAWGGVIIGPLQGGESGEYTVPEDVKPGDTIDFYCSIPGHKESGMTGKMTVVEAGGGAAAGEEAASPAASAEASPAAEGGAPAGGGAAEVDISAVELAFEPNKIEVSAGTKIKLTNDGMLEHDLAVDDWGGVVIDVLASGESGEYTVPDDVKAGDTFDFYCSVPGHKEAGMTGTITVV